MAMGIIAILEEKMHNMEIRILKAIDTKIDEYWFKQEIFVRNACENALIEWWYHNKDNIMKEIKEVI